MAALSHGRRMPPSTSHTLPRRRRRLATSVLLAVAMVFGLTSAADAARIRQDLEWTAEQVLLGLHNQARAQQGLAALAEYRDVREVARGWADHQASGRKLQHNPDYARQVCCANRRSENVAMRTLGRSLTEAGVRSSIRAMHDAYMGSSGHRANILDPAMTQVGIGMSFVQSGGTWYVYSTTDFRDGDGTEGGSGIPARRAFDDTCRSGGTSSFRDVPADSVHAATIACIEDKGITAGKGDGTFGPKELLSRGQIATFLLRTLVAAGATVPDGTPCRDGVHHEGMSAMRQWGIFTADNCDERSQVSRWQMATWSVRALQGAMGMPAPAVSADYFHDDNHHGSSTQGADNAIAAWGVVVGTGNDRFAPDSLLRRDQMATFLALLLDAARDGA